MISAQGLTVERTVFAATNGTPPEAGIDIEPDDSTQALQDVVIRDVVCRGNPGGGFLMNLHKFDSSTAPVSTTVQNITIDSELADGELVEGAGISLGNVNRDVRGHIEFSGGTVKRTRGCGVVIYKKAAHGATISISDLTVRDVAIGYHDVGHVCDPTGACAPLLLVGGTDSKNAPSDDLGGISFSKCTLDDQFDRPWIQATDTGFSLVDIDIDVDVSNPHGCKAEVQDNRSSVQLTARCHSTLPAAMPHRAPLKTEEGGPLVMIPVLSTYKRHKSDDDCVVDGAANASCFGFDPADSTAQLQAAFASGASLLTVDSARGSTWSVTPLTMNMSNMHVHLADGVSIVAKEGAFHGTGDCLIRVENAKNLTISGGKDATLRMRRDDYADSAKYRRAEWRM